MPTTVANDTVYPRCRTSDYPNFITARVFFSARKFHQFDSSNNKLCGLRLMVRVEVLGRVKVAPMLAT